MTSAATVSSETFKTYPIRLGWVTAVGDFDDLDVLRALHLAWGIASKRREAAAVVLAIGVAHDPRASQHSGQTIPHTQPTGSLDQQLEVLERCIADLRAEVLHLERLFVACRYEEIGWEGRIGIHLLPFAGRGMERALTIVMTALDDEISQVASALIDSATDVESLQRFAARLQMRRTKFGDI